MEKQIQTQNQQLTVRQQQLSSKIARVGKLTEVGFAKETVGLQKIKEMDLTVPQNKEYLQQGLSMIFTKASNLIGLKEPISGINKTDIVEMILTRYRSLSLEEIDYAFKIDRYSGDPVSHFQLFNAEYVGKVLTKYREWLRETRFSMNLPMKKPEEKKELSEEEKELLVLNGVLECFENYLSSSEILPGKSYVYDYLYQRGFLPLHTQAFKDKIKRRAVKIILRRERTENDPRQIRAQLRDIQTGKDKLRVECKRLVLMECFSRLKAQGKHLSELINQ